MTRPDWWTPEYEAAALAGVADGVAARAMIGNKPFFRQVDDVKAIVADANRTALDDRRQSAREAYWDARNETGVQGMIGLDDAIETATRVKITYDIVRAAEVAGGWDIPDPIYQAMLTAAFRAAGFEVVE